MEINDKLGPIRKGLLELAVLQVISAKKVYAADIMETLKPTEFETQEGTLYPLLSRLRREGAVEYEWVESEAGPPRKYYRLTDKGRDSLKQLHNYWEKINQTIKGLGGKRLGGRLTPITHMNKVITINLNGRAYQLEEDGYQILQDYLRSAEQKLSDDPDKKEIMSDLEQAIAEKLERFLRAGKNVVIKNEIEQALKEMGPVEGGMGESRGENTESSKTQTHKRLYRIPEGQMLGGVCTGLAAYFNVDVTIVRIIFVVLTIITHVFWLGVYIVLWIVLPTASTDQQKAAAFGAPFTAQEFINRARTEYHKFADKGEWKKWKTQLKYQHKQHKQEMKQQYRRMRDQNSHGYSPLFGVLTAIISIVWVIGLISIITSGMVYGLAIPVSIPLWISILGWVVIYGLVMSPIRAARWNNNSNYNENYNYRHHDGGFLEGLAWMAMIVIIFWAIYQYAPNSHQYYDRIGMWFQHVWDRIANS